MSSMLAGIGSAVLTLVAFGVMSLGFYASVGGLLISVLSSALVGLTVGMLAKERGKSGGY